MQHDQLGIVAPRIGKVIDVELESASKDEAKAELHKMCEKLLANPVIESFKYEVMG